MGSSDSSSSLRRSLELDNVSPTSNMNIKENPTINNDDDEYSGSSLSSILGIKLDPHQMVILSGPFWCDDDKTNILIAKPIIGAPPAPLLLRPDKITRIDQPKLSFSNSDKFVQSEENKDKALTHPMVMMWSAEYP